MTRDCCRLHDKDKCLSFVKKTETEMKKFLVKFFLAVLCLTTFHSLQGIRFIFLPNDMTEEKEKKRNEEEI